MIVKVEILYDDFDESEGRSRDKVIRAIDSALEGAAWEADGEGWIARK